MYRAAYRCGIILFYNTYWAAFVYFALNFATHACKHRARVIIIIIYRVRHYYYYYYLLLPLLLLLLLLVLLKTLSNARAA